MQLRSHWKRGVGAAACAAAMAWGPSMAADAEPKQDAKAAPTAAPVPDITAEVALTRAAVQVRRQALVTAAMDLTPEEEQLFWPLYQEYRGEMAAANDPLVALLASFLETGGELSSEEATKALADYVAVEEARTGVQKRFVPRFLEKLPPGKVARFFQVDHKLDALVDAELAVTVPLVR